MGHKTLIDGVGYEITRGRCLVDGVGYSIQKGRTLVDGVGYDVTFGSTVVAVTITGSTITSTANGGVTISGEKYRSPTDGLEVTAGDIITLEIYGRNSYAEIDGTVVQSTSSGTASYQWEVPNGISEITIEMVRSGSGFGATVNIIVTTS